VGNDVQVIADVGENYRRQLAAIDAARHHVHVQYYIFQPDYIGWQFREAMERAAARGVAVRFLYDAVGCMNLSRRFLAEMQAAGIHVACFIPFNLLTRRWIYNFRNHRKIVIADGAVAYTGGANVGKEYVGESDVGLWFDAQVELRGPAVLQLQRVFVGDWAFASGEELTGPELFPEAARCGTVAAQLAAGGPDGDAAVYHELFFSAITNAVGCIRIATAYFVPSEAILVALATAARRGVDVQLILPARGTHRFVELAGQSYYQELLEAGVRIYEFIPGYLHSKVLTVDHRWSLVGSANLDNRSMKLNFEVGLVCYDSDVTLELDRLLDEYQKSSRRLELSIWRSRPLRRRIAENSARLFSSVL
jgi:cardiolipin synthase